MRDSGVRSSCETAASSLRWRTSSLEIRAAMSLSELDSMAISPVLSRGIGARADRSPSPMRSATRVSS